MYYPNVNFKEEPFLAHGELDSMAMEEERQQSYHMQYYPPYQQSYHYPVYPTHYHSYPYPRPRPVQYYPHHYPYQHPYYPPHNHHHHHPHHYPHSSGHYD